MDDIINNIKEIRKKKAERRKGQRFRTDGMLQWDKNEITGYFRQSWKYGRILSIDEEKYTI